MEINDIIGLVICLTALFMLLGLCLWCWYLDDKKIELRKEFLKNCNEYEKSLILEWEHIRPFAFKRAKNHDGQK